jgi:hypothetical protein
LNNKLTLAILAAVSSSTFIGPAFSEINSKTLLNAHIGSKQQLPNYLTSSSFTVNPLDSSGQHVYIVHLVDAPAPQLLKCEQ